MNKIPSKRIVISSGHGKYVAGASSYINEVTEARRVVSRVTELLKAVGVRVVEYHDDVSRDRADNVNNIIRFHNAHVRDLDVSVHFNAYSQTNNPRGVEVLYYSANALAAKVSEAISDASGLTNRGAKLRADLGFLHGTHKTAVIIEVCFVDSRTDADIYLAKFEAICKAIASSISDVEIKGREEMTQEQFNQMMGEYLKQALGDKPKDWFKEATEAAKEAGVFKGDGNGNYNWELPITREELAQALCNLGLALTRSDKKGAENMDVAGTDVLLNALLALGVPGTVLASILYLVNKHVPKALEAHKIAKQTEQKAHAEQIEKIIEVATASSLAVQQSTKAFERSNDVGRSIVTTLSAIEQSMSNLDRRTVDLTIDIKNILENARKAGC